MKRIPDDVLNRACLLATERMAGVKQGHGPDHIMRVEGLALGFIGPEDDPSLASLFALVHDADDYKFFPDSGPDMPGAAHIMKSAGVPDDISAMVREELRSFGYSKRLAGKAPSITEAKAASDADMCDIMGATGIARLAEYAMSHGDPFFDSADRPRDELTGESYASCTHETPVRHMFEKVLRLPGLMLTEKGRKEAEMRLKTNVMFLKALFREQGASDWFLYLDWFLTDMRLKAVPEKPVHVCVGVYENMQYKINYVDGKDLASNVEYNRKMRPGRYYFVDGAYVCGGMDGSDHNIRRIAGFVKDLEIPERRAPKYPYQ